MHSGRGPFEVVGRDAEISQLRAVIENTDTAMPVLLITAPPGQGRTTVINAAAGASAIESIKMPGVPGLATRPYDGLVHAFTAASGHHQLGSLLPQLVEVLAMAGGEPSPAVASGVLGVFSSRSRADPLVLLIDDVDYYDPSSQDLITLLAHHAESIGLRCLLSAEASADLAHLPGLQRLELPPLDVPSVRLLLEHDIDSPIPYRVARQIHYWSGGNPLLARDLADRLTQWQLAGEQPIGSALEPSPAVLARLATSIRTLTPEQIDMLALLSQCDSLPNPLEHGGPTGCAEVAEQLVSMGKLVVFHDAVAPTHRSEALAAWASLAHTARQRLHVWIADSLATTHPAVAQFHRALAGAPDAVQRLPETAQELMAVGESDLAMEATVLAQHALPDMPADVARRLAGLQLRECYVQPVRATVRQLLGRDAPIDLGWASVMLGLAMVTGNESDLLPEHKLTPPSEGDLDLWLLAAADRCRAHVERGDLEQAEQLARSLESVATQSAPHTQILFQIVQAELALARQEPDATERLYEAIRSWRTTAVGAFDLNSVAVIFDLLALGRIGEARSFLLEVGSLEVLRHATARSAYLTARTEMEIALRRYRRAGVSLVELDRERPFNGAEGYVVRAQAVRINAACGDLRECQIIGRRLDAWVHVTTPPLARASYWAATGNAELVRGDYRKSRDLLTLALRGQAVLTQGRIDALADLMEAAMATGGPAAARHELDQYGTWLPDAAGDRAAALLARCSALAAADAEADQAFADALELAPSEVDRARTLVAFSRSLTQRGRVLQARSMLDEALEVYLAEELHGWSRHVDELLHPAIPVHTSAREAGMSEMEQKVLSLAKEGKRNREIADALYVSLRTVEAHLTRLFRKHGVSTKAQLVRSLRPERDEDDAT